MTETTIQTIALAIITGLPATIAAIAGLRQGRRNGKKTDANTVITKATQVKVDDLDTKADSIHGLTNSAFSALKGELVECTSELARARLTIVELERTVAALSGKDRRR